MTPSPSKPWYRRWFGDRSERAAVRHLKSLGYSILSRNFTCKMGEIDIVARDRDTIVIVEVRSTEGADLQKPALSVDPAKQARLTRLALYYLQKRRLLKHSARFDVICISWPADQKTPTIQHFRNAFEATGRYQMFS